MRSPSKYLSLRYLIKIAENDFCNLDQGIDYAPCEVLHLIYQKQKKTSEVLSSRFMRRYEDYALARYKNLEVKRCTSCGEELSFSEFHKDKSKKSFGLRSHCKGCRSIPF